MKRRPWPIGGAAFVLGATLSCCGVDADAAAGERPEEWSGGRATMFLADSNAFQNLAPNILSIERLVRYRRGLVLFHVEWQAPPAPNFSGLGPRFNRSSCVGCHERNGRGRPPRDDDAGSPSMVVRLGLPDAARETGAPLGLPVYGRQLNDRAVSGAVAEGRVAVHWREEPGRFPDGEAWSLRVPHWEFDWLLGIPGPFRFSPRVAPAVIGMGLLAAIPEETLARLEDEHDRDGDGISGKRNQILDGDTVSFGRFGWKAGEPSLDAQVHAAFHEDMGITSVASLRRSGGAAGEVPELAPDDSAAIVHAMHLVAVPARRDTRSAEVLRGERIFGNIGCAACHVPELQTGVLDGHAEVSGQTIRPYTDLLLHDMGPGLADGLTELRAGPTEWRTPPLWGLGLIAVVSGHEELLHDGRARGIQEAVLWHGGEAQPARDRFANLERTDRQALLAFLRSL